MAGQQDAGCEDSLETKTGVMRLVAHACRATVTVVAVRGNAAVKIAVRFANRRGGGPGEHTGDYCVRTSKSRFRRSN